MKGRKMKPTKKTQKRNTRKSSPKRLLSQISLSRGRVIIFIVGFAVIGGLMLWRSFASTGTYVPMRVTMENYFVRPTDQLCVHVDDELDWKAEGSLAPGESFTFTPKRPSCDGEVPMMSAYASWDTSDLEITTTVPYKEHMSNDAEQQGKQIKSQRVGNRAYICMFPWQNKFGTGPESQYYYSFTIKNAGNTTAYAVAMEGKQENGWINYFYHRCLNADADQDGWNDAIEYGMEYMMYRYVNSDETTKQFLASNYLRAQGTSTPGDEVDFYPPDFNDDNRVDQTDVNRIGQYEGMGNGISLDRLSPNWGDATAFNKQVFEWRRFDLNGDGYVNSSDINIVKQLVDQPIPLLLDTIKPTVRINNPVNNGYVAKGGTWNVAMHAWDNKAIAKVEFYVNGQLTCMDDTANDMFLNTALYNCIWKVPKRNGAKYTTYAKVHDSTGNVTQSTNVLVTSR